MNQDIKFQHIFLTTRMDGAYTSNAKLTVPGLGDVEIKDALSTETCEKIAQEVVAALRVKMGQTLK